MALVVGKLVAELTAEDAGFSDAIDDADKSLQDLDKSSKRASGSMKQQSANVSAAYNRQDAAAKKLKIAEGQLAEAKRRGNLTSQQMLALEARVSSARASSITATSRYNSLQRQLAATHNAAAAGAQRQARSARVLNAALVQTKSLIAMAGWAGFGAASAKLFTDSITNARALGAQTNQLQVIFGNNKSTVEAWGRQASTSLRMSQREAQGAAITFAGFGKVMGLTGTKLVTFSEQQTKLAADLASFHGISVTEAIEAMGSAYAGETETMRKYGVFLDENTLKQTAYRNGIADVGAELTSQQKQQATYLAIQEQLSHVNGDVERSNGKFGASMKTLTARYEEVSAAIGQKLMPFVQGFVDLLSGPGLNALAVGGEALGVLGKLIGGLASAFGSMPGPVQMAIMAIVGFRLAQKLAGDQMSAMGQRVTGVVSSMRGFGDQMRLQGRLAQMNGQQIGRFGQAIAVMGRQVPVMGRMQDAFIRTSQAAGRLPRVQGAVSAGWTGMKAAGGGLMAAMGGPWSIAIIGVTVLLAQWMKKKQEDAQKSAEAKAQVDEYANALKETSGAITDNIREMTAMKASQKGLIDVAGEAGVSQKGLIDTLLGTEEQFKATRAQMEAFLQVQVPKGDRLGIGQMVQDGALESLDGIRNSYVQGKDAAMDMAKATGDVQVSFDGATTTAGAMSKAMVEYAESTDGAATKVEILTKALKGLRDDKLTQEEALQGWSDGMRDLADGLGEVSAATIMANGHIDVTTAAGSKMQDMIVAQAEAWGDVAAAEKTWADSEIAAGRMTQAQAVDHLNGKLAAMRTQLVDTLVASGRTRVEAERLAATYLGIPGDIVTNFQMKGTTAAIDSLTRLQVKGATTVVGKYSMIDDTAKTRAKLDELRVKYSVVDGKLVIEDKDIPRVQGALRALGVEVTSLPSGYVKVDDSSAENLAHLRQLGIETQRLPNGTIVINPKDDEFWAAVRRAEKPGKKQMYVEWVDAGGATIKGGMPMKQADGSIQEYADGGLRPMGVPSMPARAVIEKGRGKGLVRWAEAETDWEAYIPGKRNARTYAILGEAARRLGRAVVPIRAYANGGVTDGGYGMPPGGGSDFPEWVRGVESKFGVKASTYAGHQESDRGEAGYAPNPNGLNRGIDWTGTVDQMQAFAEHLMSIAPSQPGLEQVIWQNPNTGQKLGWHGRSPDTDGSYFASDYGGHQDHVHTRQAADWSGSGAVSPDGQQQAIQDITLTKDSSRTDVARKIIAEGRKRGYTDEQIKAVLATGIQESNLQWVEGGGGAWHGYFQQDESYPGRDDPNTNITGFYDRLDEKKAADPEADIYDQIFWLQQRPGEKSAADAVANGRSGYMSEIKSKDGDASKLLAELGPSVGTTAPGDLSSTSGSGTPVFVTNWPSSGYSPSTGDSPTTTPSTPSGPTVSPGERPKIIFRKGDGSPVAPGTSPKGTSPKGTSPKSAPKASTVLGAQNAVVKARNDLAEAQTNLGIAEQKLDEARNNPKAKPSQIATAEANVTKKRNDLTDATNRLTLAETKLKEVQGTGTKSTTPSKPTVKRQGGGTIPGFGTGDIVPMMGEPGEEVIRRSVAGRPGIREALQHLNRTGRWPERHQDGGTVGFGGYADDTSDYMKPKTWNDYMHLAVGGAFTAASIVEPYLAMAQSGNVDLSKLMPTADTGSSDHDLGLSNIVGEYAGDIKEQLAEVIKLLAKGERITVKIEQDKSQSAAKMVAMQAGV